MNPTTTILLDALTDAADERLTRAALLGRTHVDVERDVLAATGLPIALVQRVVRIAAVRQVRACQRSAEARAFVASVYGYSRPARQSAQRDRARSPSLPCICDRRHVRNQESTWCARFGALMCANENRPACRR